MPDIDDDLSTDQEILNNIGEGDEPDTDESLETEVEGEDPDTATKTPDASGEQSTSKGTDGKSAKPVAGPQDLVDANGNIIATGGKERRFYETAQREKSRADKYEKDLASARQQLEAVERAGTVGTQYGLSPNEVVTGAQLIAAYKNNPVEAIQYMLTQAQANGHNVDSIISGGTDMAAIKQMLNDSLAPILGKHQAEVDTQETNARAQEIYNGFISQHPDAVVHEDALSRLLQQEPSLSLDAAYYKLQSYYHQRGLDWTKSLATLQSEHERTPVVNPAKINTQPQPPEGGGINPRRVTDTSNVADVNVSTDDIIRQAMADAGMSFN
jgi:hypothetical protein